ncbi:FAD-binding oxidoreductase [Massilia atriviolacea]|uniref:FAD-binding oxidoreductase n=1 Tax=Massilia atriviolacea TaxID=2495579 RepID=A0A430HQF7_9BURK|nr:FAD-binding oxidoreductase [Massilia atriviolacea]RSZ59733.1 FAD-binding oxidoreductase [Massilia atriviolacea]
MNHSNDFPLVNDVHSGLNATRVAEIIAPRNVAGIGAALAHAAEHDLPVAICGARHAMGGQQFGHAALLLDMRHMNRVLDFDNVNGLIEVEGGIQWPALIDYLEAAPQDGAQRWSIRQKQTGADALTLGGCLSANVHGRGLRMAPFIADVEAFKLVDANGTPHLCSRQRNPHLFSLAVGGYGLFGVIASVTLRLAPRRKMRRDVSVIGLDDLPAAFQQRIDAGYVYGDFQFAIDPAGNDFLRRGVFSCYLPVDDATPVDASGKDLSEQDWRDLLALAHTHKTDAFARYAAHYLSTDGQVAWSDRLQQTIYPDGYHRAIDDRLGHCGSEMIGELYVPRERLCDFMHEAAADFRRHGVDVIYGTIRLIEADRESYLPWARQACACVIFNLHTEHTVHGIEASNAAFRRLIDLAIARGGSYYLTYAAAASLRQVRACHPNFAAFLEWKRRLDPQQRFQSNWYRHYRDLFAAEEETPKALA